MHAFDEKTLYTDSPFFGVGMSGIHKDELWEDREYRDMEFARLYPLSSDYTHAIELLPIWW